MEPIKFFKIIVQPAVEYYCPPEWNSIRAYNMQLAIAYQESTMLFRRQINGPARGWWQFELGGLKGTEMHKASSKVMHNTWVDLHLPDNLQLRLAALEFCDLWSAVAARCLLRTLADPLPELNQPEEGWKQYIAAWNPGKPRPEKWTTSWAKARSVTDNL